MSLISQWPQLSSKLKLALIVAFASFIGLVIVFSISQLYLPEKINWTVWLIQCVPLLIFTPGLLSLHRRTFLWLCFVILLYFINAVVAVMRPNANLLDYTFMLCVVLLFVGAMLSAREINLTAKEKIENNLN